MDFKSASSSLEKFILSEPIFKKKYQDYLITHVSFSALDFKSWLLFFDDLLKEKNKIQKQLKMRSPFVKKKAYQISLLYNRVKHDAVWAKIPWWNEITERVFLGALPLRKHISDFKSLGIDSIVTMVEPFEQEDSLVGRPVRLEHYISNGIKNKSFPSPDFRPISLKTLYEATLFLNDSVSAGGGAYVHCKAGRGRSAAVIMAYLLLFCGYSYDDAENLILSRRPHVDLANKKNNILVLECLYRIFYADGDKSFFFARLKTILLPVGL